MKVIETVHEMQKIADRIKARGKTIGFVPTMGYLHEGHLSLIKEARKENSFIIVSIFVNPSQFAPNEDLAKYPRDFKRDMELCRKERVDYIFYPSEDEMYPTKELAFVEVERITESLCGRTRPTHFKGVASVVAKLFNIVKPTRAYFGQKDYQQSLVIKKMVKDLNFDLDIKVCSIVREADGLAMSSRNRYLSSAERKEAVVLNKSLERAKWMIMQGERRSSAIKHGIKELINDTSARVDYIEVRNADNLLELDVVHGRVVIAIAVYFGETRLIDNKLFDVE